MLGLLVSLALTGQTGSLPPAFLDSPDKVTLWLPEPMTREAASEGFSLSVEGAPISVTAVEPVGGPWRPTRPERPGRVVLPGSFQDELGGSEWDPNGESTEMTEVREGVFELIVTLPKGRFEYKIAVGGGWGENYGSGFIRDGSNLAIVVPEDQTRVRFLADFKAKTIRNSLEHPSEVSAPPPGGSKPMVPSGPEQFSAFRLTLAKPLDASAVTKRITLSRPGMPTRKVEPREFLDQEAFRYKGGDLGAVWSPSGTTFKVWSPTTTSAQVLLYKTATGGQPKSVPMTRGPQGVWQARVPGNLHGTFYRFRFERHGTIREAADINGRAASADLKRTMVANLSAANPPGWPSRPMVRHGDMTDSVIYELHVRDFTAQAESRVRPEWRGKYSGLAQRGLKSPSGNPIGIDYLRSLGVTDLHLLPIQSFEFTGYSWGYATTLFNVPEESYAVNPNNPLGVVREVKQMVQSVHQSGMRVVMDVVYNHTWPPEGQGSHFEMTVPHFYFRTNERGQNLNESGVGNAVADERWMVRKYVKDSLVYWAQEYKIDGFRFDLLGMHKPESVAEWVKAIRAVDPDSVIYGEPWTGGGPTHFGKNAQRGVGIAVFNDRFRGFFRGDNRSPQPGFMQGAQWDRNEADLAIRGYVGPAGHPRAFAEKPSETINYVSAHDDLTLWDKISLSMPEADERRKTGAVRIGLAATLLSQGVPFIEGGVEIGRTKGGDPNSYASGDKVNQFDWARAEQYRALADYTRQLISIRRRHPVFRLRTQDQIKRVISTWPIDKAEGMPVFELQGSLVGDSWDRVLLIFNNNAASRGIDLPEGTWQVAVEGSRAKDGFLRKTMGRVTVAPNSVSLLWQEKGG